MKKIGPYLTVQDDFIPNMQDAYSADNERGSHHLNNAASEQLNQDWPTVIAMAALIEKQRDLLIGALKDILESTIVCGDTQVLDDARAIVTRIEQGKY